jgi:hypothetical protein
MTKSTPSTSTTTVNNPVANAQLPFLTGLWGAGAGQAGINPTTGSYDPTSAAGGSFLTALQGLAGGNAAAASPGSTGLVPGAMDILSRIYGGAFPQSGYAGGPQIGALSGYAPSAIATGQAYGQDFLSAASNAYGNVAPFMSDLLDTGGAGSRLLGAGYSLYDTLAGTGGNAISALSGLGNNAISTLSGFGQSAADNLAGYANNAIGTIGGLAPSAMSAGIPAEQGLMGNAGMAIPGNPIYDSLMGLAHGQYLDPSRNPALPGVIQAATQPLVNQYMTATAPGTTGAAEAAGRYGSGALANRQSMDEYNLGQALGTTTSGIVNNAYNTGLNAMLGAGSALGSAYNTGIGNITSALSNAGSLAQAGVTGAGNLLGSAYGIGGNLLNSAYSTLGSALNNAYTTGGGLLNNAYGTGGNLINAGANALSGLAGTGLGAANTAFGAGGNLGLGGLQGLVQALSGGANATNAGYTTAGTMLNSAMQGANTGQTVLGSLAQMAPDLANFPLGDLSAAFNSVWSPLQNYGALVGAPNAGSQTSSQTTPYYQNVASNVLGGVTGLASLFGKAGPLSGLFGL